MTVDDCTIGVTTVVIGAGQAGLAAGYHLARRDQDFVVLDAAPAVGGSWRGRWDSLRLFTPAGFTHLPGLPFPAGRTEHPGKDAVADYLRDLSEKEMKPARKLLDSAGVKHDMEVRTGHVAHEIVRCAKAGKFDLIALGAKGRNAIADLLLGSVAQRVLAVAETPVVLVK